MKRPSPDLRHRLKRLAFLVALIWLLFLASCSSLWPLTGAVTGAAAGSAGGPALAAAGSASGYAIGEVLKNADGGEGEAAEVIAGAVEGLSPQDVRGLIDTAMGEERGFFDGLYTDLISLLKLAGLVAAVIMAGHLYLTWKGRQEIKELKNGGSNNGK